MTDTTRSVSTIYCDDVRQEIGGKISLMGVYQSELFVSEMPAILPKICLLITANTPIDQPFEKLTIRALHDDEVVGEVDFGDEMIESQKAVINQKRDDRDHSLITIRVVIKIEPFIILKKSRLKVIATTEDGEIKGSGLYIGMQPEEK